MGGVLQSFKTSATFDVGCSDRWMSDSVNAHVFARYCILDTPNVVRVTLKHSTKLVPGLPTVAPPSRHIVQRQQKRYAELFPSSTKEHPGTDNDQTKVYHQCPVHILQPINRGILYLSLPGTVSPNPDLMIDP